MNELLLNREAPLWEAALRKVDPSLPLRIAPDLGDDPRRIDCVLTHRIEPALLDRLPNLRLLYAVGAGVDYLIDIVRERPQLRIARIVDEAVIGDVATLAVAGTLQWLRDLPLYARQQEQAAWRPHAVRSSLGTTVAVLGLGRIGRAAARAFQALGFTVLGWARSPADLEGVQTHAGPEGLRALLPRTQVLVNTLPLTAQTAHLVGADLLRQLPRGAFVVNVGRGGTLDERALMQALDSGQVAGAFLDVFEQEPLPPDHAFWRHPAVRMTPHVASRTQPDRAAPQIVENLRRLRAGEPLLNMVDAATGY